MHLTFYCRPFVCCYWYGLYAIKAFQMCDWCVHIFYDVSFGPDRDEQRCCCCFFCSKKWKRRCIRLRLSVCMLVYVRACMRVEMASRWTLSPCINSHICKLCEFTLHVRHLTIVEFVLDVSYKIEKWQCYNLNWIDWIRLNWIEFETFSIWLYA